MPDKISLFSCLSWVACGWIPAYVAWAEDTTTTQSPLGTSLITPLNHPDMVSPSLVCVSS